MCDKVIDCVSGEVLENDNKCFLTNINGIDEMMDSNTLVGKDVQYDMNKLIEAISTFKGVVKDTFESKEINEYFGNVLDSLYENFKNDYNVKEYNICGCTAYSYVKKER